jgi:dTDP-4-amino-4,6-dideoxygalactose transaminase
VHFAQPTLGDFDDIASLFREIWKSGQITVGKYTRALEEIAENKLNVRHAVAVASCTAGLMLAIRASSVTGEVIVPSFTFPATVHAIVWAGCTPVFVDCERGTYNINVDLIEPLITSLTTAIVPVYCFGLSPRFDKLERLASERGLRLITDAAEGLGATYRGKPAGGFGDVEVFSLSPTKVVSAVEGGLVTTNNSDLAERIRSMRNYGCASDRSDTPLIGLNARLSEFHAAVGWRNLGKLEELRRRRAELAEYYMQQLRGLPGISFQSIPVGFQSPGMFMMIIVDANEAGITRDRLADALQDRGIETRKYFHPAVHQSTAYAYLRRRPHQNLTVSEKAAEQTLALPLYSHMSRETVDHVCRQLIASCGARE